MDDDRLKSVLKRLESGAITADQAYAEIKAPQRRGRHKKPKTILRLKTVDGDWVTLQPPKKRRKPTKHVLEIGRYYAELRDGGVNARKAWRMVAEKFPDRDLSEKALQQYAKTYREDKANRERLAREHTEAVAAMVQASLQAACFPLKSYIEKLKIR